MRTLMNVLIFAFSVSLVLMLMLYLLQGRMLFLSNIPGRVLTASPEDIGLLFEDVSLSTPDNEVLHGWYVPSTDSRGVVLFFHGNAGNISHRLDSIEIFHELKLDVLIFDYRGYGQSSGKTSEQGTYIDAQTAWDFLVNQRGIEPESDRRPRVLVESRLRVDQLFACDDRSRFDDFPVVEAQQFVKFRNQRRIARVDDDLARPQRHQGDVYVPRLRGTPEGEEWDAGPARFEVAL